MQMEKSTTTLRKHKDEHGLYKRAVLIFSYGQMVPCLLVIAIGGILTKILLNDKIE